MKSLTHKRILISGVCSLVLFLLFLFLGGYQEAMDEGWDGLGIWILILMCSCAFGIAQLVLMIVLAAKGIPAKNGFIQVFSTHNLVWFMGMVVLAFRADAEIAFIFFLGAITSAVSIIIVLVRESEAPKEDPNDPDSNSYTDF